MCPKIADNVLSGIKAVVHEEEVDFADIIDEESLVARGHKVPRLLVRTVANLYGNPRQRVPLKFEPTFSQCFMQVYAYSLLSYCDRVPFP